MAPTQVAPDDGWLALRQKHAVELEGFERHAQDSYGRFKDNVKREKAIIFAKHRKEEKEFHIKATEEANKVKKTTVHRTVGSKTGIQNQANRSIAPEPPRAVPAAKSTPAPRSKAPPIPKPASNATTPAGSRRSSNAAVTIIDLCSDDEEEEPVLVKEKPTLLITKKEPIAKGLSLASQSRDNVRPVVKREIPIPSATLELFGKSADAGPMNSSPFKRESGVFAQQPPQPSTQWPARPANEIGRVGIHSSASIIPQHALTAAPNTQPTSGNTDGFSNWASKNTTQNPAVWAQGARQENTRAFGSRSSSVTSSWATPTISASQGVQSSSGFTPSRFSQNYQPAKSQPQQPVAYQLGQPPMVQESAFHGLPLDDSNIEPSNEDVLMHEAPHTPTKTQQHVPNMLPSSSVASYTQRTPFLHATASPSPRTPTAQAITTSATPTPSFRRPCLPASATKDSAPAARNVRAGSLSSASAYCASSVLQSQCDASVLSHTSVFSPLGRGKRKVVDISSDEQSEYAPPSDDEEPETLFLPEEAPKSTKKQTSKPATKKARPPPPLPPAIASKGLSNRGKTGYGFKNLPKPMTSCPPASMPSTPPRAHLGRSQPCTPSTPTPAPKKPAQPMTTTPNAYAPVSRSPRKAKLDASAKISQLSEIELQNRTSIAIEEANQHEQAEAGIVEQVRGGMRSMSITPAPSTVGDNTAEDVGMLADLSDPESTTPTKHENVNHGAGWNAWTHSRESGDRQVAKLRASRPIVQDDEDDEDEDPDISKWSVINGIIVHDKDRWKLKLTQEQDRQKSMKSRRTDGGSHARAVSVVGQSESLIMT